jgi:hypothetical protein
MLRNLWHKELEQSARPVLDEYEIEEIENKIHFANEYKLIIKLNIFKEGFFHHYSGNIHRLDAINKKLVLKEKHEGVIIVDFADIVGIEIEE